MRLFVSTSAAYLLCLLIAYGQPRSIVINEFMFDPTPSAGLPEAEYIEILNVTNSTILISGWMLNGHLIPEITLMPGAWCVLCESKDLELFSNVIQCVGLEEWDKLNNDGQDIILKDKFNNTIDSLSYDRKWIKDPLKKDGGYSLELINPERNCPDKNNWSVSVNLNGGTPGFNNSVFNNHPDTSAPRIVESEWLDAFSLKLTFDEIVDFNKSAGHESVFDITSGDIFLVMVYDGYTNMQILELNEALDTGDVYSLSIQNIVDCENNYMNDTLIHIGIGKEPLFNEILITELMVDEVPTVGMPESEYIELMNNSDQILILSNTYIFTDSRTYELPDLHLLPGNYCLLVPDTKTDLFDEYKNIFALEKFPRLHNDGKELVLYNSQTGHIFSINYNKSWYKDMNKSDGGYSLEMIDIDNPCGEINNWMASQDVRGGTPGRINSLKISNPDLSHPEILKAHVFEENIISIDFNEKLHPECFDNLTMFINDLNLEDHWNYDTLSLKEIEIMLPIDLKLNDTYHLTLNGVTDCVGNMIKEDKKSIQIHKPAMADVNDIVINEILFNPKPGGVDWIEIYNQSEKYIDLKHWSLSKESQVNIQANRSITETHIIIDPYSHTVFTSDHVRLLADFPLARKENIIEVRYLPDLPDNEGYISIWTPDGIKIDEMMYHKDYHNLFLRNKEGVALERISANRPSMDQNNWESASSQSGHGTPTYRNSQYIKPGGSDTEIIIGPPIISPDQDGYDDYLNIQMINKKPGSMTNIYIFNVEGKLIKKLARGLLLGTSDRIIWDGRMDNMRYSPAGHYILVFEIFHADGDANKQKHKIVVGRKF